MTHEKKNLKIISIVCFTFILALATIGISQTVIRNASITTGNLNGVLWVQEDNFTDIQVKLNACEGHCIVKVPPGIYNGSVGLDITTNNTIFECSESGTLINFSAGGYGVDLTHTQDITIRNCEFSGAYVTIRHQSETGETNTLLGTNILVDNVKSTGNGLGNFFLGGESATNTTVNDVTIKNSISINNHQGIQINGDRPRIIGNMLYGVVNDKVGESEGIELNTDEAEECLITDNNVYNFMEEGIDVRCTRGIVSNNLVQDTGNTSQGTAINTALCYGCVVSDNVVHSAAQGVRVPRNGVLSGNVIRCISNSANTYGILASGDSGGVIYGNRFDTCKYGLAMATTNNITYFGNAYNNCTNNVFTSGVVDTKLDIYAPTSIINLSGSYGGGTAFVCLTDAGLLYASDVACP